MTDYRQFKVTSKAKALIRETYRITGRLPDEEKYGLTAQMRRAAISIGANIAEGAGRGSDNELRRFVRIAIGSAYELEFHCGTAVDLLLLQAADIETLTAQVSEVIRMLSALARRLSSPC